MFVLKANACNGSSFSDGYYVGTYYTYQGSRYANVDRDIKMAKIYKSIRSANSGANMSFENYLFLVEEVIFKSEVCDGQYSLVDLK